MVIFIIVTVIIGANGYLKHNRDGTDPQSIRKKSYVACEVANGVLLTFTYFLLHLLHNIILFFYIVN